jgi:hypothetical protein
VEGGFETMELDGAMLNALQLDADSRLERGAAGWTLTLYPRQSQMSARSASGAAIQSVVLTGRGALNDGAERRAAARATLRDDYRAVWNAIDALLEREHEAFSRKPFRRAAAMPALLAQLGASPGTWCCVDTAGMPPIVDDRMVAPAAGKN